MLSIVKGNIFTSNCQTLVNTINCNGVMGAGIAFEFKLRYPKMFEKYVEFCQRGAIDIGKLWLYNKPDENEGKHWVLNFPTKKSWKQPSKETYLREGLQRFVDTHESRGIKSIAFPILGAQNGKIPESVSIGIMASYLYSCDINIEIYRYDPGAEDDLYPRLKRKFECKKDGEIARETGLRLNLISTVRKAMSNTDTKTISQLASQKGIGAKTLEKIFNDLGVEQPVAGQMELDIGNPSAAMKRIDGQI